MLHDEFHLVVVVVIFIKVYGWKYIITGQLKKLNNNIANQFQTYANLHRIEQVFVFTQTHYYDHGDHSPDTPKYHDISPTMCGTHAHVKWYS